MFRTQCKISQHRKNQENLICNGEENQQTPTNTQLAQKSQLSDKDFKAPIMKMMQEVRANTLEMNIKIEINSKAIEKSE